MKKAFEFSDTHRSDEITISTWNEFRDALANGKFAYNEIEVALNETFLKVFDDLFTSQSDKGYLFKNLKEIKTQYLLCRGAIISTPFEAIYDRFIPDAKYIKEDRRFSPPGIEWLYLAIGNNQSLIEACCKNECRAKQGDVFAVCSFEVNRNAENRRIVDLTIGDGYSFEELNHNLEAEAQEMMSKTVAEALNQAKTTGKKNLNAARRLTRERASGFRPSLIRWTTLTYAKLLSENLFVPIVIPCKSIMYAPFQCLAMYFIKRGYDGIVYTSTVYPGGKNLVLFDKSYARPVGDIKQTVL